MRRAVHPTDRDAADSEQVEHRDLLLVDEFGVAKLHEHARMAVLGIIAHRFQDDRRTILTTTKSEAELMEFVGGAMVSRINSGIVVQDARARPPASHVGNFLHSIATQNCGNVATRNGRGISRSVGHFRQHGRRRYGTTHPTSCWHWHGGTPR